MLTIPDDWRRRAKRRREEMSLTQEALAKRIGCTAAAISNVEATSEHTAASKSRKTGYSEWIVAGLCRELSLDPPWIHVEPELGAWVAIGREMRSRHVSIERVMELVRLAMKLDEPPR